MTSYTIDEWKAEEIELKFTYHAPKLDQPARYVAIREKAKELALLVLTTTPASEEQNVAIQKIEECAFWANAAIARRE